MKISHVRLVATCLVTLLLVACSSTQLATQPTPLKPLSSSRRVTVLWSRDLGHGNADTHLAMTPVVHDGILYVADAKGSLFALRARDGQSMWRRNLNTALTAGPAVDAQAIYVVTDDARLLALTRREGRLLWQQAISSHAYTPALSQAGRVFVKTIDGTVAAFDAKDGHALWQYQQATPMMVLRASSALRLTGNTLLAGFSDGKLVALNARTGKVKWEQVVAQPTGGSDISRMVDLDTDPLINGDAIYAASYQGQLARLNLGGGDIVWSREFSAFSGLVSQGGGVAITAANSSVWSIAKDDGSVRWKQADLLYRNLGSPSIYQDMLVVGDSKGYLHFLSLDNGTIEARIKIDDAALSATPVPYGNSVIQYSDKGALKAVRVR